MELQLNKYLEKKPFLKFEREIEGKKLEPVYGFLLKFSKDLLLIQIEYEFLIDGFTIIRRKDIKRIVNSTDQKFFHKILKKEKLIPDFRNFPDIDIDNWQNALKSIRKYFKYLIVEGEDPQIDEFLIGNIQRINKDSLSFRHFDATGNWDISNTIAPYDDISRIQLDTRYTNIITKYVSKFTV